MTIIAAQEAKTSVKQRSEMKADLVHVITTEEVALESLASFSLIKSTFDRFCRFAMCGSTIE